MTYLLFFLGFFVVRFVDDLFSVCFQERLCKDIRLFTYAFSCLLLLSSRRILPILASFLSFMCVFLESLSAYYFLPSLIALSLSLQFIFTQNSLSTHLNYNNFLWLAKLCRYCCSAHVKLSCGA